MCLPNLAVGDELVGHGRPGDLRPSAAPRLPEHGRVHRRLLAQGAGLARYETVQGVLPALRPRLG